MFAILCISLAVASLLYRLLVLGHKEQSTLMFIGLPTALALLLAWLPAAKSATGMIMKGITGFLSLSRPETVTVSYESGLTPTAARALLVHGPEFDPVELPGFLRSTRI